MQKTSEVVGYQILPSDTVDGFYPTINRVLTIPGGCLEFLNHQQ